MQKSQIFSHDAVLLHRCRCLQSYYLQVILMLLYGSEIWYSVELSSGLLWGHNAEGRKFCTAAVDECWTVLNARRSSALSRWKRKLSSTMHSRASNICWDSTTFQQYCPLIFTQGFMKNNSHIWHRLTLYNSINTAWVGNILQHAVLPSCRPCLMHAVNRRP